SPELHNGAVPTPICRDDVRALFLVVALNGRFIGVTAVNRDRFGDTMATDRFLQKAQCGLCIAVLREQKVDRLAVFVDGAIQVIPLAFDLDVGLVHPPADPHRTLASMGYLLKVGQWEYDCRYSKMHGMPVTSGRGFRSLKPLWYKGVPP